MAYSAPHIGIGIKSGWKKVSFIRKGRVFKEYEAMFWLRIGPIF